MENLDAWFEARYQTLARKRPACRPAELLALLRRSLGQFEAAAPEPRLVSRTAATGHTREYWELSGIAGLRFGMYVLVPPGEGPFPGVLALHGHGYGNHEIVGLGPGGDPDKVPDTCHKHFALALVRRGLLVAAPAVIGFGERRFAADLTAGQTGA